MDKLSQPGLPAGPTSRAGMSGKSPGSNMAGKSPSSIQRDTGYPSLVPEARADMSDAASAAASSAASISADAKEAAKTAGRAVQEQASQFAADVGHELKKTAEDQKMRGVDAIQCFARAIGSAAGELENQSPRIAQSVRDAAQKVDGLSRNISNRNVDELMNAATELARSQPMLFIGGAIAAGFALSRFLKSSADNHGSTSRMSASDNRMSASDGHSGRMG